MSQTDALVQAKAPPATIKAGLLLSMLASKGYPADEHERLASMLTHGARLGVRVPAGELQGRHVTRRSVVNLRSAMEHPDVVDVYINNECALGRLVTLGAKVPSDWSDTVYVSPLGVVPKARSPGKWRLIFHLSHGGRFSVNGRIATSDGYVPYLRAEQVARVIARAGPEAWLASFDVKDAFRQIPVAPSDYRLLVMRWREQYYVDTRVGFGSRTGPANYHVLGAAVEFLLREQGCRVLRLTDDHLFVAASRAEGDEWMAGAIALLATVGIPRAPEKDVAPTRAIVFGGFLWDCQKQG